MRVHHLDCCTMRPRFTKVELLSHCLLLETQAHGLVLVDTGVGVDEVRAPRRLGALFGPVMQISAANEPMTALRQLEARGFRHDDVRHLVLTHLDFDHAGGLPDFPHPKVHVHAKEKDAALTQAAIAVDTGSGWLVHAGDAYFHRSESVRGDTAGMPWPLRCVERFIAMDYARVQENHRTLARLAKRDGVRVFGAHDSVEF